MSSINKSLGTEKDKPVLATFDKNGEPICPAGSVIDNNFSIFDKLDPAFTCEPILNPNFNDILNKQKSNLTNNFVTNRIRETTPAAGGKRRKTKKIYVRKTKQRIFKRRKHTRRR